ncbi:MAG: DUF5618 family protein [Nitrospinae bacterium]|nr:DUF5618 family protein [Nitrospinota bacterium]
MKEAIRYLDNAKDILSKSKIEDNKYVDLKYVKSACGVAYLGILKAVDEYLLKKGFMEKNLPKLVVSKANPSVDAYREMLKKHLTVHNGKLLREFEDIYAELHIAGYYRGLLRHTDTVKAVLNAAKKFVEKIK